MGRKAVKEAGISSYEKNGETYYKVNTTFKTLDGKPYKKGKQGFRTLREAINWKAQTTIEISNITMSEIDYRKTSMAILLDEYYSYKRKRVKATTMVSVELLLKKVFLDRYPNKKMEDFRINDVADTYEYVNSLTDNPGSFNNYASTIISFVEWCDLMEYMERKIVNKFKIFFEHKTITKKDDDYFEIDEIRAILGAFNENNDKEFKHKTFFTILFFTGMRKGEALALRYNDFDFMLNCVNVTKQAQAASRLGEKNKKLKYIVLDYTKTNVDKKIDVPRWLLDVINTYKTRFNKKDDDYLFLNEKSFAILSLKRAFDKACQIACVEPKKIHSTRHSYTAMLIDKGVNISYAAQQLGHTNQSTTQNVYDHLTKSRKDIGKNIINELEKI